MILFRNMGLCSFGFFTQFMHLVLAEVFQLTNEPVPPALSLRTLTAFFFYSREAAPDKKFGQPFIEFHGLSAKLGNLPVPPGINVTEYAGIQLSIIRYDDFWKDIDPKDFCCQPIDVQSGDCEKEDQILVKKPAGETNAEMGFYPVSIGFTDAPDKPQKMVVRRTGVYLLVYSNCGRLTDASVTATITAKNSFGYLPGTDYGKLIFYGWSSLVYLCITAVWVMMSLLCWRELFRIQHAITAVSFLGLVEACLWYSFYRDLNHRGIRSMTFFVVCTVASVSKSIFSYMVVLVASLGWGVTRPFLETHIVVKIGVLCVLFIILDVIRECVMSVRHSAELPPAFVIGCLLPVSMLNGGIFFWVFTSLTDLLEILKDRRQFEKLRLYRCLFGLLVFGLTMATVSLAFQINELSKVNDARWEYEWLFADATPQSLFIFVLCAMMCLWAPYRYSQKYAFNQQVGSAEVEIAEAKEGFLDDQGNLSESFWTGVPQEGHDRKVDVLGSGLRSGQCEQGLK